MKFIVKICADRFRRKRPQLKIYKKHFISSVVTLFAIFLREERPPQVSSQGAAATSAPKRWIPPSITRRDARHPEEQNDAIFRKVRG